MKRTSFEALFTLALHGLSTSRHLDYLNSSMKVTRCQALDAPRISTGAEYGCDAERMAGKVRPGQSHVSFPDRFAAWETRA